MSKKWVTISPGELEAVYDAIKCLENKSMDNEVLIKFLTRCQKTQKKITVTSAKAKGRNLQQWVCQKIADITGLPYVQQDDQCEIHSREMGQAGTDIVLRGEALRRFPYSVECKSSEFLNLQATVEQASGNMYIGTDWIIVHKKKALPTPIVIMAWDTFERLVKK